MRFFYSKELYGYFGLWVNNADFFLNASSASVLALHAMDCGPAPEHELYHIIIRRIHGHFHLIRSLFAFQRCFSMNEYLRQQLQIAVSVNKVPPRSMPTCSAHVLVSAARHLLSRVLPPAAIHLSRQQGAPACLCARCTLSGTDAGRVDQSGSHLHRRPPHCDGDPGKHCHQPHRRIVCHALDFGAPSGLPGADILCGGPVRGLCHVPQRHPRRCSLLCAVPLR